MPDAPPEAPSATPADALPESGGRAAYFFCGIGGSGMLPLALILHARGHEVQGSDRALDQGHTSEKFDFLRARGIRLHPQDGSGMTSAAQTLVTSAAVEDSVPDVAAARRLGAAELRRADLLARLFNQAATSIGVAGTSGKSTVTGMTGWILHAAGRDPTVMNGAVMTSFIDADTPFASARVGDPDLFVSEVDESDGSIALYDPAIAVLTNVTEDHKSLAELRRLFGGYLGRARMAVLNADDPETAALAAGLPAARRLTFSLEDAQADLSARNLRPAPDGIGFEVTERASGARLAAQLRVPGAHNAANALAALGAARAAGVPLEAAVAALADFTGLRRRLETVGTAETPGGPVTVIDDFAHNPDKIAATLDTLHAFPGRLLVMFQPHGFGPLRNMRDGFIEVFAGRLGPDDVLLMPEPVYYGGTVVRDISSGDITGPVAARGRQAEAHADRTACGERLQSLARPGDRIVVMGARDDTLAVFARDLMTRLSASPGTEKERP